MKSKICYVISEYNPDSSSHYFHIYELLENVSSKSDLYIYLENPSSALPPFGHAYLAHFGIPPFNLIERMFIFSILKFKGYQNFYIHYSLYSSIIASIIVRIFGGRSFFWFSQFYSHHKHRIWEEIAFRLNLDLVSFLVTSNPGMKEYFITTYHINQIKVKIFPLWINLRRFPRLSTLEKNKLKAQLRVRNKKIVLFVHWLSPRKGADKIIPIAEKLMSRIKNVVIIVIGGGPLYSSLKSEVSKKHLNKEIIMLGPISNREISKYFSIADIFFMPSKEEEFPRVVLEAMAIGVPIVATDTVGPRYLLSGMERSSLVKSSDPSVFAQKIIQLINSPATSTKLSQIERRQVKSYDLLKGVGKFLRLFMYD